MRDDYYRNFCYNPEKYDLIIDWIIDNNINCIMQESEKAREEFACIAVHDCIRNVIFGDPGTNYITNGMCVAVRANSDYNTPNYKKVLLAILP